METLLLCRRQMMQNLSFTLGLFALPLIGLAAVFALCNYHQIPLETLTRDPSAVLEAPFYVGLVSHIGILLWCAAAAICLFGAVFLSTTGEKTFSVFLAASGLLTTILLLDDVFLFHEEIAYTYFYISQKKVYAGYALLGLLYLYRFRHTILKSDFLFLALAFFFFAASIGIDLLPETVIPHHFLFEDGFKLLGIVGWSAYLIRTSYQALLTASTRVIKDDNAFSI